MIKKYLSKITRYSLDALAGRRFLQSFLDRAHREVCLLMNFGGVDFRNSGEKEVLKSLGNNLPKDTVPVIFDVGANVGDYSLAVTSIFKDNVRLYSFEPSVKEAFPVLTRNLKGYKNVALYNFGFGDKNETVALYSYPPDSSDGSEEDNSVFGSIFQRKMVRYGSTMIFKENIKLLRIDDFCQQQGINHIHLLKLDAEGNELNILHGAKHMIDSLAVDLIQFEFGGCNIDSKTFFQDFFYLLSPNYRIFRIVKDGLTPIHEYKERYEIFMSTNYLAVSRKLAQWK